MRHWELCSEGNRVRVRRWWNIYEIPGDWTMAYRYPYDVTDSDWNVYPADNFLVEKNADAVNTLENGTVIGKVREVTGKNVSKDLKRPDDFEDYFGDNYKLIKEYEAWKKSLKSQRKEDIDINEKWIWLVNKQKLKKWNQDSLIVEYVERKIFKLIRDNEPDFTRGYETKHDNKLWRDIRIIWIKDQNSFPIFKEIKNLRGVIHWDRMNSLTSLVVEIKKLKKQQIWWEQVDSSENSGLWRIE